jgi:hypothetical protein
LHSSMFAAVSPTPDFRSWLPAINRSGRKASRLDYAHYCSRATFGANG